MKSKKKKKDQNKKKRKKLSNKKKGYELKKNIEEKYIRERDETL